MKRFDVQHSMKILAALTSLSLLSGCLTAGVYDRLVTEPTKLQNPPTCEVRRSGALTELIVRARFQHAGPYTYSTGASEHLFDPEHTFPLKRVVIPKLRGKAEPCAYATTATASPALKWVIRGDDSLVYRIYKNGPVEIPAAQFEFPLRVYNRGGLAGFIFAAPLLAVLDITPIGWIAGFALHPVTGDW